MEPNNVLFLNKPNNLNLKKKMRLSSYRMVQKINYFL